MGANPAGRCPPRGRMAAAAREGADVRLPLVSRKRYEAVKAELDRRRIKEGITIRCNASHFTEAMEAAQKRMKRMRQAGEHR